MHHPTRLGGSVAATVCLLIAVAGCSRIPRTPTKPTSPSGREPMEAGEQRRVSLRADELYGQQPRRLPLVQESFALYRRLYLEGTRDYETLWRGARAGVWIGQRTKEDAPRAAVARESLDLVNSAIEVDPGRPEAYYYRAVASGLLAQSENAYGLDAMKFMIADGTRVLEIDEKWNGAAAHRLLGKVYHKAPGPPIGPGSDRKAREHLDKAVTFAPQYGANWVYLLELDVDEENIELARDHLGKFHQTVPPPGMAAEYAEWRAEVVRLTGELEQLEKVD